MHMPPQIEAPRVMMTPPPVTPQQPKNIHINPHFKGAVVTPVQGTCLLCCGHAPGDWLVRHHFQAHKDAGGSPTPSRCSDARWLVGQAPLSLCVFCHGAPGRALPACGNSAGP